MNTSFATVDAFIADNKTRYFNTPSFRSYLAEQRHRHSLETNEYKNNLRILEASNITQKIALISGVWGDIQIDHFNNYFNLLSQPFNLECYEKGTHHRGLKNPKVAEWFRTHCSGVRFLNMLYQHCKRTGKSLFQNTEEPKFLSNSKYVGDKEYILAQNTSDPEILHNLAITGNHGIRYQVAKNINTSSDTLRMFVDSYRIHDDIYSGIEDALVANPHTPNDVKTRLYLERGFESTNNTIVDTLKQLEDMLNKNQEISPDLEEEDGTVKKLRWRLMDLHDHISYLFLRQSVKNVEFCEVTLKKPYQEGDWTLYSPKDTLELALWANKVSNCVMQRESRVHSGDSEIICVEENGDPRYTVEINGSKARKRGGLNIKEIQKKGLGPGMTKDDNNFVYNMIQRALDSVV